MPLLPSTLRVIERGWLSSNSIVFDDGDAASVVDTGYCLHAEQTVQLIDRVRGEKPLTRIVNTHLHSDHVGGNALLQSRHPAHTSIPAGLAAAVDAWDVEALSYEPTGQRCPQFTYDARLRAGDVLPLGNIDWEVLAAPGHDPHMVMLFSDVTRVLISADALWENGFGAIFPEIEGESGFADQALALDAIEARRPRVVIPGHGAPFSDIDAALDRARRRLDALSASHERNARHVLKVLLKFWLLQVRATSWTQLTSKFESTRYFCVIHQRYFADQPFATMLERAVRELAASGALAIDGEHISNRD